jgi:predicted ester cyclase
MGFGPVGWAYQEDAMGSEKENVALFCRFVDELINNRNVGVIDTMVAEDFVEHDGLPGFPAGREGLKQLFAAVLGGFPDLRAQVEDSMAQGDKVMLRMTWRGTQTRPFLFLPPSDKQATFGVIDIVRVANGKLVEHWGITDQLSAFQQLGAIPVPAFQ